MGRRTVSPASNLELSTGVRTRASTRSAAPPASVDHALALRPSIERLKLAHLLLSCIPDQTLPLSGTSFSVQQLGHDIIPFVGRHYHCDPVNAVQSQTQQLQAEAEVEWQVELQRARPPRLYDEATKREEIHDSSRELVALATVSRQLALADEALRHEEGEGRMLEELEEIVRQMRLGYVLP